MKTLCDKDLRKSIFKSFYYSDYYYFYINRFCEAI